MRVPGPTDVLFIGGRSGVGKSAVAHEVSHLLAAADVSHAVIEGDNLDDAHPVPWERGINLAERNLAAMWRNYRAAGYWRLVYTNTVSVLQLGALSAALGGDVRATAVLLTADDETARSRLRERERGSAFELHVERGDRAARELDRDAPAAVHRVRTGGRSVAEVARDIVAITGWCEEPPNGRVAPPDPQS